MSGSWDASVKIWQAVPSTGLLSSVPEVEFFDHDTPIQCVAIDDSCQYVAAGAEDGRVCVWSVGKGGALLSQAHISSSGKAVSSVLWLQYGSACLLMCCSVDGNIKCMDMSFSVVASGQLGSGLLCIQCDPLGRCWAPSGLTVFSGFADGSIRLHSMVKGSFIELAKNVLVHQGGVTALSVSVDGELLVSGGEDGCIRVWQIKVSK